MTWISGLSLPIDTKPHEFGTYDVARTVQIHRVLKRTPFAFALGVCVTMLGSSCLIAPPIQAEPPDQSRPPFLDFMQPEDPVVTVDDGGGVTLSVRAFDENRHDQLFYVWLGEELRATSGVAGLETVDELAEDELFYSYGIIELTINPCGSDLEDVTNETVWVYVSDRDLDIQGSTVETEVDGFVTTFAWSLNISPGICQ